MSITEYKVDGEIWATNDNGSVSIWGQVEGKQPSCGMPAVFRVEQLEQLVEVLKWFYDGGEGTLIPESELDNIVCLLEEIVLPPIQYRVNALKNAENALGVSVEKAKAIGEILLDCGVPVSADSFIKSMILRDRSRR